MPQPPHLHPDRLLPADPDIRSVERRPHAEIAGLPIVSPHGHTDPAYGAMIADRLAAGQGIDTLALGVASWIRWQGGVTEMGEAYGVDDPLAGVLRDALAGTGTAQDRVRAVAGLAEVVPTELAGDDRCLDVIGTALSRIESRGVVATVM